ncbi:MAG: helix-turn-helix domain-containing protein [Flavobacteriales bacterium]|nr:helix-turn-helix domain-containing protein [Flavobacteriales bacterium]
MRWFVGGPGSSAGGQAGAVTFRFLPDGASALFGLRMDAMTDRRASLAEICGRTGRQFEERSIHWRTMEERIDAGTEFLLARKPLSAPDPLVRDLVQRIEECRGQVALAALKRSFAISARQVERRFTIAVGLTPKLFARIMRLSWFAEHAERCADRKLADIAREVGYFDQAHLNHDFKALTGVSPKQYFGAVGREGAAHEPAQAAPTQAAAAARHRPAAQAPRPAWPRRGPPARSLPQKHARASWRG